MLVSFDTLASDNRASGEGGCKGLLAPTAGCQLQQGLPKRRTRGLTSPACRSAHHCSHCTLLSATSAARPPPRRSDGQHAKQQERRTKQQVGSGPRKRTHRENATAHSEYRRRAPGHKLDLGRRPALRLTRQNRKKVCASRLLEDGTPGAAGGHGEAVRGLC